MKLFFSNDADSSEYFEGAPDFMLIDSSEINLETIKRRAEYLCQSGAMYLQYPDESGAWLQGRDLDLLEVDIRDLDPTDPRWEEVSYTLEDAVRVNARTMRIGLDIAEGVYVQWMGYLGNQTRPVFTERVMLKALEAFLALKAPDQDPDWPTSNHSSHSQPSTIIAVL